MTLESILSQIKNNLEWMQISTSGKTWEDLKKELEQREEDASLTLETLLLIELFLRKAGEV
jgi:hypothetical protein